MRRRGRQLGLTALALATAGGGAAGEADPLRSHFRSLHRSKAERRRAGTLPASAAIPVLKFDPLLFADEVAVEAHADADRLGHRKGPAEPETESAPSTPYDLMVEREAAARKVAAAGSRLPYVLCGPQRSAAEARKRISAATGTAGRAPEVRHAFRMELYHTHLFGLRFFSSREHCLCSAASRRAYMLVPPLSWTL